MFDLTGTCVVVTGGSTQLVLASATAVLQSGARVAVWCSKSSEASALWTELTQNPGLADRIQVTVCEPQNEQEMKKASDEVLAKFGRIDACVAAPYVEEQESILTAEATKFRASHYRVVDHIFLAFRTCAAEMARAGHGGSLVLLMNDRARRTFTGSAVIADVLTWARELREKNVRANVVLVDDAVLSDSEAQRKPAQAAAPDGGAGSTVVFLASAASRQLTGQQLHTAWPV